ncbi:hypothetical protein [Brevundimonas sp. SORGH_AS_0993]|uniref:hypothetical protein n=1 Tax=Brevundimonas sp. SORGH_AS_0993 TaxID=3041794 RepID=UPI00277D8A17|nr:hypothetical protein [Brevundimonas sp. SORGH_AS_0993]MDQ1153200.1 putative membrane protein [Brevundimonas sp. SORGH_AS_0993]
MTLFSSFLIVHVSTGLCAVLVGVMPIVTRKGGRAHRFWGRLFVGLMAVLLICAWAMTALRFNTYFLALSATATLSLFSGVRVLGRKRPDLNAEDRARPLDWAATLGVIGVGLWVLVLLASGRSDGPATVSAALAASALTMGVWDLWRFAAPTSWPFSPNLWTYEHLTKMLGAYSAVLSAFSGNFLTAMPAPWSQLWPTVLLQCLIVVWIATLLVRKRLRPLCVG